MYIEIHKVFDNGVTRIKTPNCMRCGQPSLMDVKTTSLKKWQQGMFIQDAFPELSAPERENILTGTHPGCWDEMFPNNEEEDDYDPMYGDLT